MPLSTSLQLSREIDRYINTPLAPSLSTPAGCVLCQPVRLQNSKLRQERINQTDIKDELNSAKNQLEALQELYNLKCRENELLIQQISQLQQTADSEQEARSLHHSKTISIIKDALREHH